MQIDRGFIKWMPFDSVVSTKNLLKSLVSEKNNMKMPILSEEQITTNEENILRALHNNEEVKIICFKNSKIYRLTTKLKQIENNTKKIILANDNHLYFSQIISAKVN